MQVIHFRVATAVVGVFLFAGTHHAAQSTPQGKAPVVAEIAPDQWGTPPWLREADTRPEKNENGGEERPEKRKDEEPVETDRDAFTPVTKTAGKGLFILESAYTYIDEHGVPATHSFPELLLRYGLTDRVEVRLGWNYEVGGGGNDVSGSSEDPRADQSRLSREYRLSYGLKAALTEQNGWIPSSAFILQASTPTGGASNNTELFGTYVFGWEFANRWRWDSAIRYALASENGDHFNVWAPSTVLRIPLGERLGVHAEYFGLFSDGKSVDYVRHYISPGFRYLITPNLEVGARVGWGLNEQAARFFSNVGFGWRF
jgi:hypothetical protein